MKTSIQDFMTKGFVSIPYPEELRQAVAKAAKSAKMFFDLPLDIKKSLPYSNNVDGVGYECKDQEGPKGDRKENFDITLAGKEWLEKHIEQIQNPIALKFVQDGLQMITVLAPIIINFAGEVEQVFSVSGFEKEVREGTNAFFVRFIHYPEGAEIGEETATAHVDQSGFTPHLFQNAEGLQCLTFEGKWIDMPVQEGEMVIIPAMQMQLRSNGKLKALAHRVIATKQTVRTGRDSAVCFVQLKNTPKYDKQKFGRLQEMPPGFNYNMPPEKFSKFFR